MVSYAIFSDGLQTAVRPPGFPCFRLFSGAAGRFCECDLVSFVRLVPAGVCGPAGLQLWLVRPLFLLGGTSLLKLKMLRKDELAGSSGDTLPSLTQSTFNGVPAVMISDDDVLKLASPFRFTLVGKFGLRRPNLDAIRSFFGNLKLSGFYSVGLLDSKHVAIRLFNDLDYSRMRILKWTPFFDVKEESPIVPIWISFPNLRLHFFNSKVLHALGAIFGCPLQTDQATASRTRPSVARVLVEVDITVKHAKEVWVGSKSFGYLQKVEFEKVPNFCSHCKAHGHAISDCFKLHPELKTVSNNSTGKVIPEAVTSAEKDLTGNSHVVIHDLEPSNFEMVGNQVDESPVKDNLKMDSRQVEHEKEITTENNSIDTQKLPDIFISVDSMLNSEENPNSLHNLMGDEKETETGDESEEGEIFEGNKVSRPDPRRDGSRPRRIATGNS
ncbi:hypothetical protein KFK09_003014 [Dendrobium nobile]|uniref:DUF4283 domain-containing protein n=1 Tax=Dendrobium nobile TaxID=94219 RepID=A0A8T3C391_DENNO|nr:hypothetical protein KFK09_003014 [Dendrobium nobile]